MTANKSRHPPASSRAEPNREPVAGAGGEGQSREPGLCSAQRRSRRSPQPRCPSATAEQPPPHTNRARAGAYPAPRPPRRSPKGQKSRCAVLGRVFAHAAGSCAEPGAASVSLGRRVPRHGRHRASGARQRRRRCHSRAGGGGRATAAPVRACVSARLRRAGGRAGQRGQGRGVLPLSANQQRAGAVTSGASAYFPAAGAAGGHRRVRAGAGPGRVPGFVPAVTEPLLL